GGPPCRAERDRLASALRALAHAPAPPAPSPGFARAFFSRLERERRPLERLADLFQLPRWRYALAASAAAALVVAGYAVREPRGRRLLEMDMAEHLDLLENYEVVASLGSVESAEDAEVVANLDALEGRP